MAKAKRMVLAILLVALPAFSQNDVLTNFKSHVQYLASDALKGRGTGSREIRTASEYIANQFESVGLSPGLDQSFYQSFARPGQAKGEVNVIGIIPAAEAALQSLLFTAHYDAYGIGEKDAKGDSIFNSAVDNAVGVAALIELAREFAAEKPPTQNLVFIATAAEEGGTYGSRYYVENPVFPLSEVTVVLNIDGFNVRGATPDYFVMPRQGVDFLDEIESVAASMGWNYESPEWVDGMNTNFDTAPFLTKGIPALTLWTGEGLKGKTGRPSRVPLDRLGRIHTPDDEINEHWNWDGVGEHLDLYKTVADFFLKNPGEISVTDPQLFKQ